MLKVFVVPALKTRFPVGPSFIEASATPAELLKIIDLLLATVTDEKLPVDIDTVVMIAVLMVAEPAVNVVVETDVKIGPVIVDTVYVAFVDAGILMLVPPTTVGNITVPPPWMEVKS